MMDTLLVFIEPLTRLIVIGIGIVLFFIFIAHPLLNYFLVNHEIERRKRLLEEMPLIDDPLEVEPSQLGRQPEAALDDRQIPNVGRRSAKDTLDRLAEGNPEKAGELIKQWINKDS